MDDRPSEGILTMTMTEAAHIPTGRATLIANAVGPRLTLGPANAGDHLSIRALLAEVGCEPSISEFQAQLEEPFYEPNDRLLVREGAKPVAHVRLQNREIHFGAQILPVAWLTNLATIAEYRRRGLATELVSAAERQMRADGAVLGLVRTSHPGLFLRRGWTPWGRACQSRAGAREILAQIARRRAEQPLVWEPVTPLARPAPLSTRLWRHVEQSALERIYQANVARSFGAPVRTSDYWRWLVSRHGFGDIYVAIAGRDRWSLDAKGIVGYAVVKQDRIVELLAAPDRPDAVEHLITRLCGEFIEQDRYELRLDGSPDHPWHAEMMAAGGTLSTPNAENGQFLLARMFEPASFLCGLRSDLTARAQAAELATGSNLSLHADSFQARITIVEDGVGIDFESAGRHVVSGQLGPLIQLLLGHEDPTRALASGLLRSSDEIATRLAATLFPKLPFWRPPWDNLPSDGTQA